MEKRHRNDLDSALISEQPGLFLTILGLLISIVMGLSIKTAVSSVFVKTKIAEAIRNVGKDWRIEYGSAEFIFQEGIAPAFGIVFKDVKVASTAHCVVGAGAYIRNLVLPVSLYSGLARGQWVREIKIDKAKLELVESAADCKTNVVLQSLSKSKVQSKNTISFVDDKPTNQYSAEIEMVNIQSLDIYYPNKFISNFSFSKFIVENKSNSPRIVTVESELNLGDLVKFDRAKAKVRMEYNEFPKKVFKIEIQSKLREGEINSQLTIDPDIELVQAGFDFNNLSLLTFKEILNDKVDSALIKSLWFQGKGKLEGSIRKTEEVKWSVEGWKLFGDVGEVSGDVVNGKGTKVDIKDSQKIYFKNIKLNQLVETFGKINQFDQVGDWGEASGQISWATTESGLVKGDLKNQKVIFSSKGIRSLEPLDQSLFEASFAKDKVDFKISATGNDEAKWTIEGRYNPKSNSQLSIRGKKIQLSESTSRLLLEGQKTLLLDNFQFDGVLREGKYNYSTKAQINDLNYKYFDAKNVYIVIHSDSSSQTSSRIDIKSIAINSSGLELLKGIISEFNKNHFEKVEMLYAQDSLGKKLSISAGKDLTLKIKEDNHYALDGFLRMATKNWNISGSRESFKINFKQ